jgi:hypothetical protein
MQVNGNEPRNEKSMNDTDRFVGTWHLISTEFRAEDGSPAQSPYGTEPQGLLMYDALGNMAAQLAQGQRKPFRTADRKAGSDIETREAFESYQAYYGRYRIDADKQFVIHTVTQALLPNWVGTEQLRQFTFANKNLILRTPPMMIGGRAVTGELVWERAD